MMKETSYAQKRANKYFYKAMIITMILAATAYLIGYFLNVYTAIVFSFGIIYGIAVWDILTKKLLPLSWNYKREIQGIEGEQFVDKKLKETFEPDYLVLHDITLKGQKWNIDHVVIGKNGIFVIETKTHKGKIKCDDDTWFQIKNDGNPKFFKKSPSKQVVGNACQLKYFLKERYPKLSNVYVHALIIFPLKDTIIDVQRAPKYCKIFNDIDKMISYIQESNTDLDLSQEELNEVKKILS
jgi:hypothetical protein